MLARRGTQGLPAAADTEHTRSGSGERERGWGELLAPVAKSTLSHHLRVLRDAGITRTRQEGTRCYVTLRRDDLQTRFPGLLDVVLDVADTDNVGHHAGLTAATAE